MRERCNTTPQRIVAPPPCRNVDIGVDRRWIVVAQHCEHSRVVTRRLPRKAKTTKNGKVCAVFVPLTQPLCCSQALPCCTASKMAIAAFTLVHSAARKHSSPFRRKLLRCTVLRERVLRCTTNARVCDAVAPEILRRDAERRTQTDEELLRDARKSLWGCTFFYTCRQMISAVLAGRS